MICTGRLARVLKWRLLRPSAARRLATTNRQCPTPHLQADARVKWLCFVMSTVNLLLFYLQSAYSDKGWMTLIALATTVVLLVFFTAGHLLVRKPLQFRVSTMLCVATALAVPLAWLGHDIRAAKKQELFLAKVRSQGSWFRYDVSPVERRKAANKLQRWLLDSFGDDFFANVEWLDISATNNGFERIADVRQLKGVNFRACKITDDNLECCRDQPFLKQLCLDDTPITDAGLDYLIGLENLEELWLRNTRVTEQGIERLKRVLPDCRIHTSHRLRDR